VQLLSVIFSTIALFISACSFAVAVFSYRRDRARVRAWSTIVWIEAAPGVKIPNMYLRIANVGRRPVLMLNLVKRSGRTTWRQTLTDPVEHEPDGSPFLHPDELQRRSVAHRAALRLGEGEVFELIFRPEDCPSLVLTNEGSFAKASQLFVEEVAGTLHCVRDAGRNLPQLFAAWKP
jgi:hypothetical protein